MTGVSLPEDRKNLLFGSLGVYPSKQMRPPLLKKVSRVSLDRLTPLSFNQESKAEMLSGRISLDRGLSTHVMDVIENANIHKNGKNLISEAIKDPEITFQMLEKALISAIILKKTDKHILNLMVACRLKVEPVRKAPKIRHRAQTTNPLSSGGIQRIAKGPLRKTPPSESPLLYTKNKENDYSELSNDTHFTPEDRALIRFVVDYSPKNSLSLSIIEDHAKNSKVTSDGLLRAIKVLQEKETQTPTIKKIAAQFLEIHKKRFQNPKAPFLLQPIKIPPSFPEKKEYEWIPSEPPELNLDETEVL